MSKTRTPKYRVEYLDNTVESRKSRRYTAERTMAWDGRATRARLEAWREAINASFESSGVNAHLSDALGYVVRIGRSRIVNQRTGEVVAEYVPPMFEVV